MCMCVCVCVTGARDVLSALLHNNNKGGHPKTKPDIPELTLRRHGAYQDSAPVPPCSNALRRQTTTRRRSLPDLHICLEDLLIIVRSLVMLAYARMTYNFFFGIMVYLGKQIKTSNMLQKRAEGVEEKRRRLWRLRHEVSTLAAVSRCETGTIAIETFGVWVGEGIRRLPLPPYIIHGRVANLAM